MLRPSRGQLAQRENSRFVKFCRLWDCVQDRPSYTRNFLHGKALVSNRKTSSMHAQLWFLQNISFANCLFSHQTKRTKAVATKTSEWKGHVAWTKRSSNLKMVRYSTMQLYNTIQPQLPNDVIVQSSPAIHEANTDDEQQCQQAKRRVLSEAPNIEG